MLNELKSTDFDHLVECSLCRSECLRNLDSIEPSVQEMIETTALELHSLPLPSHKDQRICLMTMMLAYLSFPESSPTRIVRNRQYKRPATCSIEPLFPNWYHCNLGKHKDTPGLVKIDVEQRSDKSGWLFTVLSLFFD